MNNCFILLREGNDFNDKEKNFIWEQGYILIFVSIFWSSPCQVFYFRLCESCQQMYAEIPLY